MEDYGKYHVETRLSDESYSNSGGNPTRINKVSVGGVGCQDNVYIHGHSFKTGKVLSGFIGLSREAMDELAQKWLEARGYTVIRR